ncbi:MAG: 50S ribosomal protein L6 [Chloroflexota bacterium]|nr:50S ribosomal protein L6 [Chloroflexota bacterium]
MSRIGKMPITIPKGVEVDIQGNIVRVKGPRGELTRTLSPLISISLEEGILKVTRESDDKVHRSLHGLTRSLLANMVTGVSDGFQKELELVGVGYRAQAASGEKISIQLGYSHPIEVDPPAGVSVTLKDPTHIVVAGINKELVGDIAAKIRAFRPPDHYKGKGVRYANEHVRLKPGKSGKVGAKR